MARLDIHTSFPQHDLQRQTLSGSFSDKQQVSIGGRVFSKAIDSLNIRANSFRQVVYSSKGYNAFEAFVGVEDGTGAENARVVFAVLGDGQILFKSPPMNMGSRPMRISVPLKGISGVTLRVEESPPNNSTRFARGLFADPVFVAFKPILPDPLPVQPPTTQALPGRMKDIMLVRQLALDNITVDVNGRRIDFGYVQPQIANGRVFVPMRPIFEAMGAFVAFNSEKKEVIAIRDKTEVKMVIGSQWALRNSTGIKLDAPAFNKFGTTGLTTE